MEDVFASLKEMEWNNIIPKEDLIYEPDTWFTKLSRSKWKTKRYWWSNGIDETLQEECPPGWKRGRLLENRKKWKAKKGSGCGQKSHSFIVKYADGRTEIVKGLKPWCKKNNYTYSSILYLRRGQQHYHKDIVEVKKLDTTS